MSPALHQPASAEATTKHRPALRLVKTHDMPREEWLSVRQGGIGSSDAATAVGLNPYKSQLVDSAVQVSQFANQI